MTIVDMANLAKWVLWYISNRTKIILHVNFLSHMDFAAVFANLLISKKLRDFENILKCFTSFLELTSYQNLPVSMISLNFWISNLRKSISLKWDIFYLWLTWLSRLNNWSRLLGKAMECFFQAIHSGYFPDCKTWIARCKN